MVDFGYYDSQMKSFDTITIKPFDNSLDYCNSGILCGITDVLLRRLQKVQNNAAKVNDSKHYDHITPNLKDFHWLPIRKRIEFMILLLTFKCMQGCVPEGIVSQTSHYKDSKIKR